MLCRKWAKQGLRWEGEWGCPEESLGWPGQFQEEAAGRSSCLWCAQRGPTKPRTPWAGLSDKKAGEVEDTETWGFQDKFILGPELWGVCSNSLLWGILRRRRSDMPIANRTEWAQGVFCQVIFYKWIIWGWPQELVLPEVRFLGESQCHWEHANACCLVEWFLVYGAQLASEMKARSHFDRQDWKRPEQIPNWTTERVILNWNLPQNCLQGANYIQDLRACLTLMFLGFGNASHAQVLLVGHSSEHGGGSLQEDKETRSGWAMSPAWVGERYARNTHRWCPLSSGPLPGRDARESWPEGP